MIKFIFFLILFAISILVTVSYDNTIFTQQTYEQEISDSLLEDDTSLILSNQKSEYYGILEINKIGLKQGFYHYSSNENTVDKNIELISKNCYPKNPCSFVLASHSGNSSISFFKNLDTLALNDQAILYWQNQKIEYQLVKILHQAKDGTITVSSSNVSQLVLTTCNKEQKNIQDIYIFQMIVHSN